MRLRPVRFRRRESVRPAIVQDRVIETAGHDARLNSLHRAQSTDPRAIRVRLPAPQSLVPRTGRKHGRHEAAQHLGIDNRIGDLIRLLGDQAPPDRVALGPQILAFILETFAVSDSRRCRAARNPGASRCRRRTSASARRSRPRGIAWGRPRIRTPLSSSKLEHLAFVVRRSADQKILAPPAPQASFSHSRFDSNPPAAATSALARNVDRLAIQH